MKDIRCLQTWTCLKWSSEFVPSRPSFMHDHLGHILWDRLLSIRTANMEINLFLTDYKQRCKWKDGHYEIILTLIAPIKKSFKDNLSTWHVGFSTDVIYLILLKWLDRVLNVPQTVLCTILLYKNQAGANKSQHYSNFLSANHGSLPLNRAHS